MDGLTTIATEDVLSEEEIVQHLTEAYHKFDSSGDQELDKFEFTKDWVYLGLRGTEAEIDDAFLEVDANKSGTDNLRPIVDLFYLFLRCHRHAGIHLLHQEQQDG